MTQDLEYKGRTLQAIKEPARPTLYWPRGAGAVRADKTGALFQAQDSALVGRRLVLQFGPGSQSVRIAANLPPYNPAGPVDYPLAGDEQELARSGVTLTPGSWMETRALLLPTGPIQTATSLPDGVQGPLRTDVGYTDLATVTSQTPSGSVEAPPSTIANNGLPTGDGAYFEALRPLWVGPIRPTPVNSDEVEAKYGEQTAAVPRVVAVESCRVISATVSEVPFRYVTKHDQANPTAHAASAPLPPDSAPRTETADGATYQDDRYGSQRMLQAAELAPLRLGPVLLYWTAYAAADYTLGDTDASISISKPAGTYQRVNALNTTISDYSARDPGWPLMTHLALAYDTSGPECMREQAAAVPCTLTVRYRGTVGGDCFAVVRTERSAVRVKLTTQATAIDAVATGHIEGSASTEDALGGVAQIWLEGQDFTVELLSVVLEWGHVLA
jgi:hypothetical protein